MIARNHQIQQTGNTEIEYHGKRPSCQQEVLGCRRIFGDEFLQLFVDILQGLNGISGHPNASESEGQKCHSLTWWFPSQEQCYLGWLWSEERKGGLSREVSLVRGKSSLSFSLELVTWRPPFFSAWLEAQPHFPHFQTCHRQQVWRKLLGFSLLYFKCSCDSQRLSAHMCLQRLASRI